MSAMRGAAASDLHYILSKRPDEYRLWLERWALHVERLVTGRRSGNVVAADFGAR